MVTTIGRCDGCDAMAQLDDRVCRGCLDDPRRGRAWARAMRRCRTEPAFAQRVFDSLDNEHARANFLHFFGSELLSPEQRARLVPVAPAPKARGTNVLTLRPRPPRP